MPLDRHEPARDLLYPLPPPGRTWHHQRVYTNYYGFAIPEHGLGVYLYLRCQPAFPLSHGGVMIYRGLHNVDPMDAEFLDYQISMPWPEVAGNTVTTANGLRFEILDPGRAVRITYTSDDGRTRIDVLGEAVTPLLARGHVTPGEEDHHGGDDGAPTPGGFEQFMHFTGEVVVDGAPYPVDAYDVRDRSWHQLRTEAQDAVKAPPVCWCPVYLGEDLAMHHVGFEAPEAEPVWRSVYDLPPEKIVPLSGWIYSAKEDEALRIVRTRREIFEHHPVSFMPLRQELQVEDERGRVLTFSGEALSAGIVPVWPNTSMRGGVYRWTDEAGRVSHTMTMELWFDRWHREMRRRHPVVVGG